MPILRGRILEQSDVYTDGWNVYDGLLNSGYRHHRIHHHQNEFARCRNHVNGIESFWSFAKLRLAKLRGIQHDRFLHLKECEWRWNQTAAFFPSKADKTLILYVQNRIDYLHLI